MRDTFRGGLRGDWQNNSLPFIARRNRGRRAELVLLFLSLVHSVRRSLSHRANCICTLSNVFAERTPVVPARRSFDRVRFIRVQVTEGLAAVNFV